LLFSSPRFLTTTKKRVLLVLLVFLVAFWIRFLTFNFMRAHLNDAAWFQHGSYTVFDKRAKEILGGGRWFWIDDSSRTDLIQYPPAFPTWVATIFWLYRIDPSQELLRIFWILLGEVLPLIAKARSRRRLFLVNAFQICKTWHTSDNRKVLIASSTTKRTFDNLLPVHRWCFMQSDITLARRTRQIFQ